LLEANTDDEIREAARRWLRCGGAAAGPAALAHAAAGIMNPSAVRPVFPDLGRVLVASGSRHPSSRAQTAELPEGWGLIESAGEDQGDPAAYAADFGGCVARAARDGSYDTLVIFGGDTARALMAALAIDELEPLGEILPGMAFSRLPGGLHLVTKAGGFGPPDILTQLRRRAYA